ncbi:MAG: peptidase, partial [Alphaproteobacteria bacterium]
MTRGIFPTITVDGEVIPRDAIIAEAQNHPAPKNRPGNAWRSAARALVIRTLLLRRAGAIGLAPSPRELSPGRRETDDEALIRQVLEAEVEPAPPSEAEVLAFYAADPERFRERALYEASHILFSADGTDSAAAKRAEARAEA